MRLAGQPLLSSESPRWGLKNRYMSASCPSVRGGWSKAWVGVWLIIGVFVTSWVFISIWICGTSLAWVHGHAITNKIRDDIKCIKPAYRRAFRRVVVCFPIPCYALRFLVAIRTHRPVKWWMKKANLTIMPMPFAHSASHYPPKCAW